MIDDEQFFNEHPDMETRARGIALLKCLHNIQRLIDDYPLSVTPPNLASLPSSVRGRHHRALVKALMDTNGNINASARLIGITPKTIHYHINCHKLRAWVNSLRNNNQQNKLAS